MNSLLIPWDEKEGLPYIEAWIKLLTEMKDAFHRYRNDPANTPPEGGWPPTPFDYPDTKSWCIAHNEWRERNGLPLQKFPQLDPPRKWRKWTRRNKPQTPQTPKPEGDGT